MGNSLNLETMIALGCAVVLGLVFCIAAFALSESANGRRLKRRLAAMRDRAQGKPLPDSSVTRSLTRQQSATPKIDRMARRWLPQRDVLAARLARSGRAISVGQYIIASICLAMLSAGIVALCSLTWCSGEWESAGSPPLSTSFPKPSI
jgi:Flp pilus assembly protein TadB